MYAGRHKIGAHFPCKPLKSLLFDPFENRILRNTLYSKPLKKIDVIHS